MTDPALWSRSKRFLLAATVCGLLAIKFRAAVAAGIDLPSATSDWLFPSRLNALITSVNGQWDPFVLRLINSVFEAGVAGICISLIARCCRPSNGGGWAVLVNGGVQLVIASCSTPPVVESWREPWFVGLLCGAVLALGFVRRIRLGVITLFIVVASAAWWCGALRPAPLEYPAPGDPRGAAVRRYLQTGDAAGLPAHASAERPAMIAALAEPEVRARLPFAARAALPLGQPVESQFAFIAISARRLHELTGPAGIGLRLPSGERIAALQGALPADHDWHRLNLPVPNGPFTIFSEGEVEVGPAVEYAAGSRDAGKLLRTWPVWGGLAVICVLGGVLCLVIPNERRGWKLAWNPRERAVLPWLALLAYAGVLAPFLDVYAGGSDSAGYLGSARLLEHLQLTAVVPLPSDLAATHQLNPAGFLPRGFALSPAAAADPAAVMVPTYPVGLPLLFCLALWVFPAAAAIPAVILFHLLAGLVATYLLARQLTLPQRWSLAAAAFLALCPLYVFMGLQPMSDVPSLFWITAAVLLALQSGPRIPDRGSVSRAATWPALACGVATAVAVLTRPANLIAVPVIALALPWRASLKSGLLWILAGLPFALLQALYNQRLYGHPFLTGYGSAGGLFSAEWIGPTALHYLRWIPALLTPVVFAFLALPFRVRIAPPTRWLLPIWAGLFAAFYATYSCTHEAWWYLRFLLPAFPALIIGALLVLRDCAAAAPSAASAPSSRHLFATAVAVCIGTWLLAESSHLHVLDSGRGNRVYADSARWLETNTPDNALVVCSYTSGALHYYSHRAFFQPASAAEAGQVLSAAAAAHRPIYAEFFQFDQQPLAWFSGGHWTQVHRFGDILIWRWVKSA